MKQAEFERRYLSEMALRKQLHNENVTLKGRLTEWPRLKMAFCHCCRDRDEEFSSCN